MANQLTELKVSEVSLVDRPANAEVDPKTGKKIPRATVALWKRDDTEIEKYHQDQARDKGAWTDGATKEKSDTADKMSATAATPQDHQACSRAHSDAAHAHRQAAAAAEMVGHTQAADSHRAAAQRHDEKAVEHFRQSGVVKGGDPVTEVEFRKAIKADDPWDDEDSLCKAVNGKMEDGKVFPKSDYAYTPGDKSSEWKLRLTSTPGGKPDSAIVGAAAAAFSPGGFRGKKVQLPSDAVAGVKAKVRAAWRRANPDKSTDDMPESIRKGDEMAVTLEEIQKRQEAQEAEIALLKADRDAALAETATVLKMSKKERKAFATMTAEKRKAYMAADTEKRKAMMDECAKARTEKRATEAMTADELKKYNQAGAAEKALLLESQLAKMEEQKKVAKAAKKAKAKSGDSEDEEDDGDGDEEDTKDEEKKAKKIAKFEQVRKSVAVLTDQVKKDAEVIATITKQNRLVKFEKMAGEDLPYTAGTAVEKGTMLMTLADSLPGGEDGDVFKAALGAMKTRDRALEPHFHEIGKHGVGGDNDPIAIMNLKAGEIAKRDNVTPAEAFAKALTENPQLYQQYEEERRQRTMA